MDIFHKVNSYKVWSYNLWLSQEIPNCKWLKNNVKQKLSDLFINEWFANIETSSNSVFYRIFKKEFGLAKYLSGVQNKRLFSFIKFRTRNHRMPIETGNWHRIPVNERLCTQCNNKLGDEFHYLLECRALDNERNQLLKPYYYRNPNTFKLEKLMNTRNNATKSKLYRLVDIIISNRRY